jgi:hypothetical protein
MEFLAFASFAILVIGWLVAPSRPVVVSAARVEDREAA